MTWALRHSSQNQDHVLRERSYLWRQNWGKASISTDLHMLIHPSYCCLHMYHYCCNAPSTCLCISKLSLPRQRSFCLLQGGNFSGSTKVILSLKMADSQLDQSWIFHGVWNSTSYICGLSFPCCSAEPEGERSPAGKGLSKRHALNQMLRAMTTELVSKWQPHWENILLIPYTVLTYET